MSTQGERERKANLSIGLKVMQNSATYKAVMDRVAERCGSGKWWKGWVLADEEKAKWMRQMAKGYLAFDQLIQDMINEGESARKILEEGKVIDGSPSPDA